MPVTSIVPKKKEPLAWPNDNDFLAQKIASRLMEGDFDKGLVDQIKILCEAIIKIIDAKHPPAKRAPRRYHDEHDPLWRYLYTTLAIDHLIQLQHWKHLKTITGED